MKCVLSVANHHRMHIDQMDVKCAFLNEDLELPEGYKQENMVCKLKKSLYGLKQAPRQWNQKFNSFMTRVGFNRCISNQCLYVRK